MKQNRILESITVIFSMLLSQIIIYECGYGAVLGYIHVIGGCSKLGSLQYYCGGSNVPGSYMTTPLVLTFLVPPILVKILAPKFGHIFSWRRVVLLYIATLPLTFITYGVLSLLSLHHQGV